MMRSRETLLDARLSVVLETGLDGRVFDVDGDTVPGLYAVGNAAGLAEGGMHGHGSLEGTFLGVACLLVSSRKSRGKRSREWRSRGHVDRRETDFCAPAVVTICLA
jgi:hypothetical protein